MFDSHKQLFNTLIHGFLLKPKTLVSQCFKIWYLNYFWLERNLWKKMNIVSLFVKFSSTKANVMVFNQYLLFLTHYIRAENVERDLFPLSRNKNSLCVSVKGIQQKKKFEKTSVFMLNLGFFLRSNISLMLQIRFMLFVLKAFFFFNGFILFH